jgi:hypothetical protein
MRTVVVVGEVKMGRELHCFNEALFDYLLHCKKMLQNTVELRVARAVVLIKQ